MSKKAMDPPLEGRERHTVRRMIASNMLNGMLSSAPVCDRTAINPTKWAKAAVVFTDALLRELKQ